MTGTLLAAASGVGFGLFQSVNVRAVRGLDPFVSTFLQISVATLVLALACVVSGDVDRLGDASGWAFADFAVAGLLHFLAGWTLLNLSQKRIGAARTSPLLTTVPLFGVAVAFVTLGQLPGALGSAAIVLMVGGAWIVASRSGSTGGWRDAAPGLLSAFCWALSPVFTLRGLDHLDSPLLGLTIGLVASVVAYAAAFTASRGGVDWGAVRGQALRLKVVAGLLVAGATLGRWAALDFTDVGVVLAMNLVSVPIVLVGAPLMAGGRLEHVTRRIWLGAALVVAGALLLIVVP